MFLRQKINILLPKLRRIPMRYYFIFGLLLVMVLYVVAFRERTLVYNYGGETCHQRLVVLPGIFAQAGSDKYEITTRGGLKVGSQQISATSLCVSPAVAPSENSSETLAYAPWGGWLARLSFKVQAGGYPVVATNALKIPIPVSRPLSLPLSGPDTTFSYQLEADSKKAPCSSADDQLECDMPALKLKQGSKYTLSIEKYFKDKEVGGVITADIETLSPVSVVGSSIAKDALVYDKPKSVTITVDKPLKDAELSAWRIDGDSPTPIEATTTFDGQDTVLTFAEDLPRQATIGIKVVSLEATDGSTPLDEEYILTFRTSGGPKVTGVNVGSSNIELGTQIVVTFDQDLAPDQDIGPQITVNGGVALQARTGNQLIFSTNATSRCASVSIGLKGEIASPHDISGQSAWQFSGRMRCYIITTIGASSQGRAINAYHFGESGPSIVYTGAIHGNEASTKYLMDRWIQDIEANPSKLPGSKRIIVIPTINPDGFARGTRLNARGIDLNRNFATSDWKKDIQHTNGSAFPGGGGDEPMSEPETRAIANFIAAQRPELVVSYHSIGGMVISNGSGQAGARANQYASLSSYRLSGGDSAEFGYQITGTADDYYREKLGVPSILIELGSHSYHQFERNQSAMWAMMR